MLHGIRKAVIVNILLELNLFFITWLRL